MHKHHTVSLVRGLYKKRLSCRKICLVATSLRDAHEKTKQNKKDWHLVSHEVVDVRGNASFGIWVSILSRLEYTLKPDCKASSK